MRRLPFLLLGLACATTPPPAPIVAGEVIVRTSDAALLTSELFNAAAGRTDVRVAGVECLTKRICKVRLAREGGTADEEWTRTLVTTVSAALPAGLESVEPNVVSQPREK